MARELVHVQLGRNGEAVGEPYTTAVDRNDPTDVRGLFRDALTHARVDGDGNGYEIQVSRPEGERLFVYSAKN
ncbi:hypothetical protein [Spirillospora sp. NBC_01491]|uniref:hypothetical protein n=1 Tax=Spirillospora sp. NBC_01491 TaxID=2976007 RepID=UPI002E2F7B77|nr:hypothetical protein [Spirillospora sp. NBC_01491]